MAKLTERRIKMLREVQKEIRRTVKQQKSQLGEEFKFNMSQWIKAKPSCTLDGFCATAGCMAGTLVLQQGYKPYFHVMPDVNDPNLTRVSFEGEVFKNDPDDIQDVSEVAEQLLGLNDYEGNLLFCPMDFRSDIWQGLDHNEPGDAIIAIDRFIKAGGEINETNEW